MQKTGATLVGRLQTPVGSVAAAVGLALALRVPYLDDPLGPDEGGYLLVARRWDGAGPHLYGELWVDRPPLLLALFRLADAVGGAVTLRLIACLAVGLLVVVAGWTGWMLSGVRGARWAAFSVAAVSSSRLLAGQSTDGELMSVPLVLLACALALAALRHPRRGSATALLAGVCGASAMLVKQNMVDGLVFAAVLVLGHAVTGRLDPRTTVRLLSALAVGVAVPAVLVLGWAHSFTPGIGVLWSDLYGFRSDALGVILEQNLDPPLDRLVLLLWLSLVSGITPLIVLFGCTRRRSTADAGSAPLAAAIGAMLLVAVITMAGGASFWSQYLLGLLPALALISGALGRTWTRPRALTVGLAVTSGCIAAVAGAAVHSATGYPFSGTVAVVDWLRSSAHERDSLAVTYGQPNVIAMSGLQPAYPYLWSLPTRTLDPELDRFTRILRGPRAPTWVVEWNAVTSWELDTAGQLRATLSRRYDHVATACGTAVYLHERAARKPAWTGDGCTT